MKTINIYLLRHGKTSGLPALYGRTDVAVATDIQIAICNGVQALQLGVEAIVTSPLQRCRVAADLLHQTLDIPLTVIDDFQEMHFGDVDGVPFDELTEQWPTLERFWSQPAQVTLPNAESLGEFHVRITQAWQALCHHAEQDTLVVCHGGTIRMILASILGMDWQNPALYSVLSIDNQSLTHITLTDKQYFRVRSIGRPISAIDTI